MSKPKKKQPKNHTQSLTLHVVEMEDKILIAPLDAQAYKHYKRWAYRNLPSRTQYWDNTAKLYVIDLEKVNTTLDGSNIVDTLKATFDVKGYLPFEV